MLYYTVTAVGQCKYYIRIIKLGQPLINITITIYTIIQMDTITLPITQKNEMELCQSKSTNMLFTYKPHEFKYSAVPCYLL